MSQRGPGDEYVALTAYERRQLELIEQTLEHEDPRSAGREHGDKPGGESCPIWLAFVVTWVWSALMSMAAGSVILVLLALAGGAAFLAHARWQRHRTAAEPGQAGA